MHDGMACILCVDDVDVASLKTVIERTYGEPIEVLTANNVGEARDILRTRGEEVDVIVLDIFMPDNNPTGLDLGREVADKIPIIFISGHPESHFDDKIEGLAPLAFHEKPVDPDKLVHQIRTALALKRPAEMLDPDLAFLRHLCLCQVPATIVSVRFALRDVHQEKANSPKECPWDFAPLALGFRHLERCVRDHGGRIVHFRGLSALAIFPGSGTSRDHFAQALQALRETNWAIGKLLSKNLYCARFSAGLITGTVIMGLLGDRNPGHAAIVGRSADIAEQIAYAANPGEAGTAYKWLAMAERREIERLGGQTRKELQLLIGVLELVEVIFASC